MGMFFVYMLKSAFCLAAFYLFYKMLLSKETFHRFNRFALLGTLVASFLLPAVRIQSLVRQESDNLLFDLGALMVEPLQTLESEAVADTSRWTSVLLLVYLVGVVCFWTKHLLALGNMYRLIRSGRRETREDGSVLVVHQGNVAPFSWMRYIVISEKDLGENGDVIIRHETAHILNRHSWDLIVADMCISLQWFNPASWLVKSELQNVHEFEADEWVINQGIDAKRYQLLLIKKAVGTRLYSMANSFNHSSLKKRITMMIRKKSNPWARMKYLYVLPLATIAVAAFAHPEISSELDEISSAKVSDLSAIMKADLPKNVSADQKEMVVKGLVVDERTRQPMAAVSILIKGTNKGTLTDSEGRFSLPVTMGQVLQASYIGKQTCAVAVVPDLPKVLSFRMKDEVENPDGLVVKGERSAADDKALHLNMALAKSSDNEGDKAQQPVKKVASDEDVFMVVEKMPEFPGGMSALMKFLGANIKYPAEAAKQKIQGRVIVQFVVMKDGSVANLKVIRSVHPLLDAEALRVLGMMPKWIPGMQRGENVNVKFTVPASFKLQASEVKKDSVSQSTIHVKGDAVKN